MYYLLDMLDVFKGHVFGKLLPLDVYNLACVNKQFNGVIGRCVIDSSVIREINKLFGMLFKDRIDDFKNLLMDNVAIVSGNFIVECILKNKKLNNNKQINIYVNNLDIHKFRNIINSFGFARYIHNGAMVLIPSVYYNYCEFGIDDYIFTFKDTGKISLDTILEIDNVFDIHKNYYKYENGKDTIVMKYLNDILCRETNFYCNYFLDDCITEYLKYYSIGFKFKNINNRYIFNIAKCDNFHSKYKIVGCNDIMKTDIVGIMNFKKIKQCKMKCVKGMHKHYKRGHLHFIFVYT